MYCGVGLTLGGRGGGVGGGDGDGVRCGGLANMASLILSITSVLVLSSGSSSTLHGRHTG